MINGGIDPFTKRHKLAHNGRFQKLEALHCIQNTIDPFPKRHRLVHNDGFPKFEALYCSVNMVNSTEIS